MTARLVIAGTHSGIGKTTIAAGLMTALRRRGLTVQPFKVGPDYIDGGHHTVAAGRPCRNLDTWMMPPESVRSLFAHACRAADIAVIEGVMGVYDGAGYDEETGSTAEVAKLLQAPVVLVVDASKLARSAAAVVLGYQRFDPDLPLAGFIVNRAGGDHHGAGVARVIEKATGLPVFGWLPRDERLKFQERHLGLIPAAETPNAGAFVEAAGDVVTRCLDLDRLLAALRVECGAVAPRLRSECGAVAPRLRSECGAVVPRLLSECGAVAPRLPSECGAVAPRLPSECGAVAPRLPSECGAVAPRLHTECGAVAPRLPSESRSDSATLAVARDEAFHFTYEENLELLQAAGARLAFFSPLRDTALPDGAAGAILSGGFPEVHAAPLAANVSMKQALRDAHERGLPIYAECGGLMYLTEKIVDHEGREYDMVGLLPGRSLMSQRLTLGYRLARAASPSWLFPAGETVRGHEFHYSHWQGRPASLPPAYALLPSSGVGETWSDGACLGNLWASYVHLNFWGKPELAERFVTACRG